MPDAARVFDVGPFWKELELMLKFVRGRLQHGQTDIEGTKMDSHVEGAVKTLRKQVIASPEHAKEASRLFFWDDCKKALSPVYDAAHHKPRGSVHFGHFYGCLYRLQLLAFELPIGCWPKAGHGQGSKPYAAPPYPERVIVKEQLNSKMDSADRSGKRHCSRSGTDDNWWRCKTCWKWNNPSRAKMHNGQMACYSCYQPGPKGKTNDLALDGKEVSKGLDEKGIWRWKNPPYPLYEGAGFWLFAKAPFWICDTPQDASELDKFVPRAGHADGNFTKWINAKYGKQYPFLNLWDSDKGWQYGLLNRLDRETSGPVVVVKNEDSFIKLRKTRDDHDWHKEYVCLVHGHVPVDEWEGFLQNWAVLTEKQGAYGSVGNTRIVEKREHKARNITTIYQVRSYYSGRGTSKSNGYTLIKVRILTGMRHQIRVHMNHLLKTLGSRIGKREDFGIVADFMYLKNETSQSDKAICSRVFLHEHVLGMWDPEDPCSTVCVKAEIPQDLEECLAKLQPDDDMNQRLAYHKEERARSDPVHKFRQRYEIDAQERDHFASDFWRKRPLARDTLMQAFAAKAGSGLPTLSMQGDHSYLFGCVRKETEKRLKETEKRPQHFAKDAKTHAEGGKSCATSVRGRHRNAQGPELQAMQAAEWALKWHIDDRLWAQGQKEADKAREEALANEPLPPGWRRMSGRSVFYLHESGRREQRRPIPDPSLLDGWTKFENPSEPGTFFYVHIVTRQTKQTPPTAEDVLPSGWSKVASRNNPESYFHVHKETGTTQIGRPCDGPIEELPPGWEKVASSSGKPYYHNRDTGHGQFHRPVGAAVVAITGAGAPLAGLPPNWKKQTSSSGKTYYFNAATGESQFHNPGGVKQWTRKVSGSSGRVFFFCEATGESCWDRPCEGLVEEPHAGTPPGSPPPELEEPELEEAPLTPSFARPLTEGAPSTPPGF